MSAISLLALAAALEAVGDAVMRKGLHTRSTGAASLWFLLGAAVLSAYGYVVNAPPWDFGRVIGVYIVFFFISAQLVSWFAFKQTPDWSILVGGALILAGGVVISAGGGKLSPQ